MKYKINKYMGGSKNVLDLICEYINDKKTVPQNNQDILNIIKNKDNLILLMGIRNVEGEYERIVKSDFYEKNKGNIVCIDIQDGDYSKEDVYFLKLDFNHPQSMAHMWKNLKGNVKRMIFDLSTIKAWKWGQDMFNYKLKNDPYLINWFNMFFNMFTKDGELIFDANSGIMVPAFNKDIININATPIKKDEITIMIDNNIKLFKQIGLDVEIKQLHPIIINSPYTPDNGLVNYYIIKK